MKRLAPLLVGLSLSLSSLSALSAGQWQRFTPATDLLQGKALQQAGTLVLDLPALSENGGAVPLGVAFRGDLPDDDPLTAIHILSTANPRPEIISFVLQDARIVPDLSTRIRLSESQTVIAIAISRSGKAWVAEQPVRVTVSGCLMPGQVPDNDTIRMQNPRVAVAPRLAKDQSAEVKALVQHPMETGLRTDSSGKAVPQNLVQDLTVGLDGQDALVVRFHSGTAANPYVRLNLHPGQAGNAQLTWRDQAGRSLSESRPLPAG